MTYTILLLNCNLDKFSKLLEIENIVFIVEIFKETPLLKLLESPKYLQI